MDFSKKICVAILGVLAFFGIFAGGFVMIVGTYFLYSSGSIKGKFCVGRECIYEIQLGNNFCVAKQSYNNLFINDTVHILNGVNKTCLIYSSEDTLYDKYASLVLLPLGSFCAISLFFLWLFKKFRKRGESEYQESEGDEERGEERGEIEGKNNIVV